MRWWDLGMESSASSSDASGSRSRGSWEASCCDAAVRMALRDGTSAMKVAEESGEVRRYLPARQPHLRMRLRVRSRLRVRLRHRARRGLVIHRGGEGLQKFDATRVASRCVIQIDIDTGNKGL